MTQTQNRSGRALAAVWCVGVIAYVIAIANRTSLSALGLDAAQHFSLDPATLSLFAVLQLAVYGAVQIPVGLALDRWGSRRVLSIGIVLMAVAQTGLALAPTPWLAIGARVFLGAGDATVFPSVLRVIGIRFPRRVAPVAVQVTGLVGQFGQIISVVPFAAFVRTIGWSQGFLSLAATTAFIAVLTWFAVSDDGRAASEHTDLRRRVTESWMGPGTRMAFWTHFVCPFSATTFGMLWGYPFLVGAERLPNSAAQAILTVFVAFGLVAGPVVGALSARFAEQRIVLVLVVVGAQMAMWLVVIALPGPSPVWLLVILAAVICVGGPASVMAFDIAREHNPTERLSTATGIVNGAGFLAAVVVVFLIGLVLRLTSAPGTEYCLDSFRLALLVQVPFWVLGCVMVIRAHRQIRRRPLPDPAHAELITRRRQPQG